MYLVDRQVKNSQWTRREPKRMLSIKRTTLSTRFALRPIVISVLIIATANDELSGVQADTLTSIDVPLHVVTAGGSSLTSVCFRLIGSVGQPVPGYSSGSTNYVAAGVLTATAGTSGDAIFFNSFEDC
jgi:hypothetical protein